MDQCCKTLLVPLFLDKIQQIRNNASLLVKDTIDLVPKSDYASDEYLHLLMPVTDTSAYASDRYQCFF